ncbi:ArnT family glycosyltransferase [Syntrophorhabdus aromaticivorans]|nr:glycosyltransferase family 39 protein [Syntrophorhabdus aromaticivorans]
MIVREMLRSGNYFVPTVNGVVDLDKPLLSYWAVLPFAWLFGLSESVVRMPGTLAAITLVLLIFVVGRRLFGFRVGLTAALLLLASPMFVFWGRTASADLLNTLAIWTIFWIFLAGASDGRLRHLFLLYSVGAIASFVKGPVAPAVSLSSLGLYSCIGVLLQSRNQGFTANALNGNVFAEFRWIVSHRALTGLLAGITIFGYLLFVHVAGAGSWLSSSLMWKENVVRFFAPFDHADPPHVYLMQILFFCAPWSFFMVSSLCNVKYWKSCRENRWILLSAMGIFLFFTISGSRRSYYILPLIPALALITGKVLVDWMDGKTTVNMRIMSVSSWITSLVVALAGICLAYVYSTMEIYRDGSQLVMASVAMIGGAGCLFFFTRKKSWAGLVLLFVVVFVFEVWGFTRGMELAEKKRTLPAFAQEVTKRLSGVEDSKIFLYQQGTASLLFYLNRRSTIESVDTIEDIERLVHKSTDGYLIIDLNEARTPELNRRLYQMRTICIQNTDAREGKERFALLKFH